MIQETEKYMKMHCMAEPGEKIVLGLSGGADSVCLFHVLRKLGYEMEAVHVNHGIRGEEAGRDEHFVKELCECFSVPVHNFFFDVPAMSKEQRWSEEETGRYVRRKAFREVMEKSGASKIALAHHGNDRAETFLFHLSRGTGLKGLTSMRPVDGNYIRPLLWTRREEIEAFLEKEGYGFVEDSTNHSLCYSRNKIRHMVMPVLEQMNAQSVAHICSAAEKLCEAECYIDREAQRVFEKSVITEDAGEIILQQEYFFQADQVLRVPVLQKCVQYVADSLKDFTEEHFRMMLELFGLQTGKELSLPAGITAARTYQGIRLFVPKEIKQQGAVKIDGPGEYRFGEKIFQVTIEKRNKEESFPINYYTKYFDYDKIAGDVFLRTRQPGDYLEINKEHGKKALQDYFVNEKVPKEKRGQVVLLAQESHILWVVGKRISEYYKVTEDTVRVLKIQLIGGNGHEEI